MFGNLILKIQACLKRGQCFLVYLGANVLKLISSATGKRVRGTSTPAEKPNPKTAIFIWPLSLTYSILTIKNCSQLMENAGWTKRVQNKKKIELFHFNVLFLCQVEIQIRNRNLDQNSKFGSKIEIWIKNRNLDQKSKFGYRNLENLDFEIWKIWIWKFGKYGFRNLENFDEKLKFRFDFWSKFRFLIQISISDSSNFNSW